MVDPDFAPHFPDCETAEPTLREVLEAYYVRGGFTKAQARSLAIEYLAMARK